MGEFYKLTLRNAKGEMIRECYLEINGDKSNMAFCTPDENIYYPLSKLEKISDEEVEEALRKGYGYNPTLKP